MSPSFSHAEARGSSRSGSPTGGSPLGGFLPGDSASDSFRRPDEPLRRTHGASLCLATAAAATALLLGVAGCQTPAQTQAPVYGSTVPPPATHAIGQPAAYGYAPAAGTPLPGPSTTWQGAAAPAPPAANTWTWAQSGNTAPAVPQPTAPNMQQYGSQLANQANQYQQNLTNQTQQYATQLQNQPQQYLNQANQSLANQQQQLNAQLQNSANQLQQGVNAQTQQLGNQFQQGMQSAQQQFNGQMQQAMPQMPAGPQQQTANGWWPFASPAGMPPARAVPAQPTRY
ncbi:MAG: hypothetical protein ACKOTB_10950 [Planctomycetia bacterium]